ncbi:MAG: hypothetical protein K2P32_02385, partial [Clostridia bacterium]|nr:hypothetical protein [Clostridia bacterium]
MAHIVDVEFADIFALVISVAEEILLSVFDISSLLIVDKITLLVFDLISAKELIFLPIGDDYFKLFSRSVECFDTSVDIV